MSEMDPPGLDRSDLCAPDEETKPPAVCRYLRVRPDPGARCASCGSPDVAGLPSFAAGSGVAFRPTANDVYCRRCGHIETPLYVEAASRH